MTEEIQKAIDQATTQHLDTLIEVGPKAENAQKLINQIRILHSLSQKDEEIDNAREKWTYENGRSDEELRLREKTLDLEQQKLELEQQKFELEKQKHADDVQVKQQTLELEEKKFDFEQGRYEIETEMRKQSTEIEREKLKSSKFDIGLKAIGAGLGLIFNTWISSKVLQLEETGVVGSFVAKKIFGSMLNKADTNV